MKKLKDKNETRSKDEKDKNGSL